LLQGSINTVENTSQVVPAVNNVQPTVHSQISESVRFAPESENDEKPSHFVRTNTPHPKELMKKKEMLKQRNSSNLESNRQNSESSNHADLVQASPQNQTQQLQSQPQLPIISTKTIDDSSSLNQQSQSATTQQTNETILNSMKLITTNRQKSKEIISQSNSLNNDVGVDESTEKPTENGNIPNHKNENENGLSPDEEENQASNRMKHVDFKLSFGNGVVIINDNEEETSPSLPSSPTKLENENDSNQLTNDIDTSLLSNGSGQFRLRRRDTPHHLKGARLNSPNNKAQQLDPNEMKEILERYTSNNNSNNTATVTTPSSTCSASTDSKLLKPKVVLD
jgi:hypothetical protein